jgi:2,3-bisphosphoglycerate-dependent phosphoglycerate mutase
MVPVTIERCFPIGCRNNGGKGRFVGVWWMEKRIFLIRHCEAEGQPLEARLTDKGFRQAGELVDFFKGVEVDWIISSPFLRAIQSIEPLAKDRNIEVAIDERLAERVLSTVVLPNWMDMLKATFSDLALELDGGESSLKAMDRAVAVVNEIFQGEANTTLIVTHGNLMALLIKYFNKEFGFEEWRKLSNPDVFLLRYYEEVVSIGRVFIERE